MAWFIFFLIFIPILLAMIFVGGLIGVGLLALIYVLAVNLVWWFCNRNS